MDNVILNIYDLLPGDQSNAAASSPSGTSSLSSFFSGILAPLGMGAYHTSVDVRGFRYQFGSGMGISRTAAPITGGETAESRRVMPPNVSFRESIIIGQTWFEKGEINEIIQRMRNDKFTGDKYHLANRNCNHFSETFAMVLIHGAALLEEDKTDFTLQKFPAWVNRLAKTGTAMGLHDGNVCDVLAEARIAAGIKENCAETKKRAAKASSSADRSQKKELTEKQKAVLAKLKSMK
ncbi:hypothetical protein ACHAXN_003414 [Cyclotella atomus]